ncbi:hypothetical protein AXG93_942s1010 [Marchantia polymorpha subsp. ruderalis]|uniref:Uncharacterized protein n=1 Tax=Marchantia polymorpha subsp. ruderalis TaxID=1480154 RepID=A0A176WB82_MARPO|nr:hypothetical protein AXG93_942s1010 [Marchantia polymorpha subsp. ruderalis]
MREMQPYECETTIERLSKDWLQNGLAHLLEWVVRNIQHEVVEWSSNAAGKGVVEGQALKVAEMQGDDGDLTFDSESVKEGKEVVSAKEVITDPEDEQISSPPQRIERPMGRHESQPRKRRRIHEVAMSKERVCRAVPIKLRSPNSRDGSKMKARRLIMEADSSTESRACCVARAFHSIGGSRVEYGEREGSTSGEGASEFCGEPYASNVKPGYEERERLSYHDGGSTSGTR